jgi:hypothetical protein
LLSTIASLSRFDGRNQMRQDSSGLRTAAQSWRASRSV